MLCSSYRVVTFVTHLSTENLSLQHQHNAYMFSTLYSTEPILFTPFEEISSVFLLAQSSSTKP